MTLAFRHLAGRANMARTDGQEDGFDKMEDHLRSLLDPKEDERPISGFRDATATEVGRGDRVEPGAVRRIRA